MKRFLSRPSLLYFVLYFGLISIFRWRFDWSLLSIWLGGLLGIGFVWVDRLAHVYFTKPHEQLSIQVRRLVSSRKYFDALRLIDQRKNEQRHLTARSLLFLMVWVVAAFYVLTSTGSVFASSMVMGVGLSVLVSMLVDWNNLAKLKSWLFWQIKRDVSDDETKIVVVVFGVLFVLLSLIMV